MTTYLLVTKSPAGEKIGIPFQIYDEQNPDSVSLMLHQAWEALQQKRVLIAARH